jgi:excinuclease UvrABC nuclease subunit
MALHDHIRRKLGTLPHRPGIDLMKDRSGRVPCVGHATTTSNWSPENPTWPP